MNAFLRNKVELKCKRQLFPDQDSLVLSSNEILNFFKHYNECNKKPYYVGAYAIYF